METSELELARKPALFILMNSARFFIVLGSTLVARITHRSFFCLLRAEQTEPAFHTSSPFWLKIHAAFS
jgi:hypothetical protein